MRKNKVYIFLRKVINIKRPVGEKVNNKLDIKAKISKAKEGEGSAVGEE